MTRNIRVVFALLLWAVAAHAEYQFNVGAQLNLGAGSNDFAPYYFMPTVTARLHSLKTCNLTFGPPTRSTSPNALTSHGVWK